MRYLCVALCVLFANAISAQNVPNRGFEDWADEFQFETPTYWLSSNLREGTMNVHKSSTAHTGNYSIRLDNDENQGFGYFLIGHVGEDGPDGGAPYVSDFDSVTGWYMCDIPAGDTALVMTFKYGITDTTMVMSPITGTASSWTRFSFPVPTHAQTEVFFGVVSTNPFETGITNPNSWIIIDDVEFVKSGGPTPAALVDPSFEQWDSAITHEPEGWNTVNFMSLLNNDPMSVQKTSDAYSGTYALKLQTVNVDGRGKIGWLFNGEVPGEGGFKGGFEYTAVPTRLSGYYKYIPVGMDTAVIAILGSIYDQANDSAVDVFFQLQELYSTSTYTAFNLPINYDTANFKINQLNIIALSSRKLFDNPDDAAVGTALYLDDLWLESKCAFADTVELFAYSDTIISYNKTETPTFSMDTSYSKYLWSTGDTSYVIVLNSDTSSIEVTVTDSSGCVVSDELVIYLNLLVGVDELVESNFEFFPNPVMSSLTVAAEHKTQMRVYNASAQLVSESVLLAGLNKVDVHYWQSGIYLIEFQDTKTGKWTFAKVVKK